MTISFTLNGRRVTATAATHETILEVLQRDFGLFGARESCGQGLCGCCTLLVNGTAVSGCLYLAAFVDGAELDDRRRAGAQRRATPDSARVRREERVPVRLLHAWVHPDDERASEPSSTAVRGRYSPLPVGESLPLCGLSRHHRSRQARRGAAEELAPGGSEGPALHDYLTGSRPVIFRNIWFSWQMNSIISEPSATISCSIRTVNGREYAFGSSMVTSISRLPKFTRRNRSVIWQRVGIRTAPRIEPSIARLPALHAAEVVRLDHERVALPSADRVTVPVRLRLTLRRQAPAVGVDRPKTVVRLVDDQGLVRQLDDLSRLRVEMVLHGPCGRHSASGLS